MNNIRFEIGKKTIERNVASNWNELSLKQLLYVAPRIILQKESDDLKKELVWYFINIKDKHLMLMNRSQLEGLFPAVEWLFKDVNLTINLIPVLNLKTRKYFGPSDELKNISAAEFAFSDKFMNEFLKKRDEAQLNLLIATLYRPQFKGVKKDSPYYKGDIREPFNENTIDQRADLFSNLSLNYRLAILAFYLGCRSNISKQFPDIFNAQKKSKNKKTGWLGFFYELSGDKLGNYHAVANMNLFELLFILRKMNENAAEAERKT